MVRLAMQDDTERPERALIPDQTAFEAVVLECKEQDSRWRVDPDDPDSDFKKELNFKFKIIDPDGDFNDRWVWGSVNAWLSPSSKLRAWVIGILDLDVLPEGFVLDTEDLEGKQCRIIVKQWVSKDGEKKGNSVDDVRPTKARAAAPSSVQEFREQNAPAIEDEPF